MDNDDTTLAKTPRSKPKPKPRAASRAAAPKAAAVPAAAPKHAASSTAPDPGIREPRVPAPPKKLSSAPVVDDGAGESGANSAAKPPMLKKKDLVDQVVQAVGGKKKGVKEIVDATLAALGEALSRGDGLNLPPLGRAHVNRQRDLDGGEMMIVKLRRDDGGAAPKRKAVRDDSGD